jgi:thiamine biosynthesis lipoprotein
MNCIQTGRCAIVVASALALLMTGCRRAAVAEPAAVERSRIAMGSELRLTAWTSDEPGTLAAFEAAFDEFDRLDALMSVWKDGSDVVRVNAAAGKAPVSVSPEVREVLRDARQIGDWTDGKFDVTFGALSGLWKFDQDLDGRIPDPGDIAARVPLIDYSEVQIDEGAGTVYLARAGMKLHLGGIGKGYAVDRAAEILRARGVANFMIQSGGDLLASGRRGSRPWRVGIQDPRGAADTSFAALDLQDAALSTSGDYERFFMRDGRRYHHILDPDTGQPAAGNRSVSIVAKSSTLADGLATGVFVLGPETGMALIERLPGVEGVIVTVENTVLVSSGLQGRLTTLRPPTDAP